MRTIINPQLLNEYRDKTGVPMLSIGRSNIVFNKAAKGLIGDEFQFVIEQEGGNFAMTEVAKDGFKATLSGKHQLPTAGAPCIASYMKKFLKPGVKRIRFKIGEFKNGLRPLSFVE